MYVRKTNPAEAYFDSLFKTIKPAMVKAEKSSLISTPIMTAFTDFVGD